eukprot:c16457_g1_i1 orf=1347-2294(+)
MMAGNETTRRRRVQGRTSGTSDASSTSQIGRSNTAPGRHQQPLHHHHHHYHYHHHYHHFPRPFNEEQSLLLSLEGGVTAPGESLSQADPTYADQQGLVNSRPTFINSLQSAIISREANEDTDRLDERLRAAAMQSHRPGFSANLLEEFSLLFEDDEDSWSDDELLELDIQEWLAAVGFEEAVHSDVHSLSEQGLSKALIRRLQKVVFVPRGTRADTGVATVSLDQEDCSVCLEHFVSGQQLICLPCKHRFHPDCVTPWLESHAKCPYCRANVTFERTDAASSSQTGSGSTVSLIEDDLIAWMEAVDSGLSQLSIR